MAIRRWQKTVIRLCPEAIKALGEMRKRYGRGRSANRNIVSNAIIFYNQHTPNGFSVDGKPWPYPLEHSNESDLQPPNTGAGPQFPRSGSKPELRLV